MADSNGTKPAPYRIYFADPDTDMLKWAAAHLKATDVIVDTFERGEDVLLAYAKIKPDVLLSEGRLAGMSGIELLKRVRQQNPNAMRCVVHESNSCRIIAVSVDTPRPSSRAVATSRGIASPSSL